MRAILSRWRRVRRARRDFEAARLGFFRSYDEYQDMGVIMRGADPGEWGRVMTPIQDQTHEWSERMRQTRATLERLERP
jgi:hypothetical protein